MNESFLCCLFFCVVDFHVAIAEAKTFSVNVATGKKRFNISYKWKGKSRWCEDAHEKGRIFLHGFIHNKPFTHGLSQGMGEIMLCS